MCFLLHPLPHPALFLERLKISTSEFSQWLSRNVTVERSENDRDVERNVSTRRKNRYESIRQPSIIYTDTVLKILNKVKL